MTLNAMETEDTSTSASLRDNLQELVSSVPEWEPESQSINPKWLEHQQSSGTPCQRSKLSSLYGGKPEARSTIDASMQIDIQALCIVILQHLSHRQMVTSIV